jgi:hypothetical protein
MENLKRRLTIGFIAVLAAIGLVGCAKKGPPPPPPLLELGDRNCVTEPNFSGAQQVILDEEKPTKVTLDSYASCWQPAGRSRDVYAAFDLPAAMAEPYILSVTSVPIGEGLFAPRLILFDSKGKITREIQHSAFTFHGAALYVGIRVHVGERFLVVASNAGSIGKQVSKIEDQLHVQTMSAGIVMFNKHTGSEEKNDYTYALNGDVTISARPMPKLN